MKTIINKLTTFSVIMMALLACKKEGGLIIADDSKVTPSTISTTNTTVVIARDRLNDTIATFTWTKSDFGFATGVNYSIQVDKQGNNFAAPKETIVGTFSPGATPKKAFTGLEFNNMLLALNLPAGTAVPVEVRVKASVGTLGSVAAPEATVAPAYSAPVTITATPVALTSFLYVPGAYQGWDPSTAESLISPTGNGIHEGVINFTPGNLTFKVLAKRAWGPPEYGSGAIAGTIAVGGGDIAAPNAGMLKLTVDINANTIAFAPYSFGIIGSATPTGWNSDTDMSYNNATQTWSVTIPLTAGAIKFRLNDDWGVNYGGSGGVLAAGGADINVTETGNYRVQFSIPAGTYALTKL